MSNFGALTYKNRSFIGCRPKNYKEPVTSDQRSAITGFGTGSIEGKDFAILKLGKSFLYMEVSNER
jgi:hypothetical protein